MRDIRINRRPSLSNFNKLNLKPLYFFMLLFGSNVALWSCVMLYVNETERKYTSEWTVILPSSGRNSNVNIGTLGQANSENSSPYAEISIDPRANYKVIASGPDVLERASQISGVSLAQFGKPKVKLVDPTATIELSVSANTPELAKLQAESLNKAIEEKLNSLRADEVAKRENAVMTAIDQSKKNLDQAQNELIRFRNQTGLYNSDQIKGLLTTVNNVTEQAVLKRAEEAQAQQELSTLQTTLGFTPEQVPLSYKLQSDRQLASLLSQYAETRKELTIQSSVLTSAHPIMKTLNDEEVTLRTRIANRSRELLGRSVSTNELTTLLTPAIGGEGAASNPEAYSLLVSLKGELRGLQNQNSRLNNELTNLNVNLRKLAANEPKLQDLERNVRLAEVVYTSALGKQDIARADYYAVYPLTQLLSSPSYNESPSSPKIKLALMGGVAGSTLVSLGLIIIFLRERKKIYA